MHIPSERVSKKMYSEDASIWFVPANGNEIACLIKAPTSVIKALIAGCRSELIIGLDGNYLCLGMRIYDTPQNPMFIFKIQLHEEEHKSLFEFLDFYTTPLFLFNEMNSCLAWCNMGITETDKVEIHKLIKEPSALYTGEFTNNLHVVLDNFCATTDLANNKQRTSIPYYKVAISLSPWTAIEHHFVGINEHHAILIDDKKEKEGIVFEKTIWASLESVFPTTLYKSPSVQIGNQVRELTDILAFHKYGSFLIESKDCSVFESGFERDVIRKNKGIQKQIKKATKQLIGTYKAFKRGEKITTECGAEITIERNTPPHCIILITELIHIGDWSDIESLLLNAMAETGAFFHLLDLREFTSLLRGSNGAAELFDYNLMKRCELFVKTKSVHIRSQ